MLTGGPVNGPDQLSNAGLCVNSTAPSQTIYMQSTSCKYATLIDKMALYFFCLMGYIVLSKFRRELLVFHAHKCKKEVHLLLKSCNVYVHHIYLQV